MCILLQNGRDMKTSVLGALRLLPLVSVLTACAVSSHQERATPKGEVAAPAAATTVAPAPAIPVEAQQQFDKALVTLKSGQTAAATQQLQQLAGRYPTFAGPLVNLGLMELKAARYEPAANLFKQALERDVKSAPAHHYLGVSYRNLGRFKEAEAAYKDAISADDSYAVAHLNLGVLYDLYLQHPELALPEYQRYQELQGTPDAKVAGWIKELSGRLNADKRNKSAGGAAP